MDGDKVVMNFKANRAGEKASESGDDADKGQGGRTSPRPTGQQTTVTLTVAAAMKSRAAVRRKMENNKVLTRFKSGDTIQIGSATEVTSEGGRLYG